MRTRTLVRTTAFVAAAGAAYLGVAGPAAACGGLVGENGSISLLRTSTLAAWHDGIEHYVTSFEFSGTGESVGSIVPLPGVPTNVEAGGEWTLQRLQIEVQPPIEFAAEEAGASLSRDAAGVQILLETTVDALDITVLAGGADEVGQWALDNGFFLTPDAPEVLDFYASRSEVFMAARFDASRAAEQGLASGQGTPVHITIPTDQPWVPLRILGLGLPGKEAVEADVFLLTDEEPDLLAGGRGLTVERSVAASDNLLFDLRSDRGMEWVPEDMWLTHLTLSEDAGDLDYDLSVGTGASAPTAEAAGLVLPNRDAGQIVDRLDEAVDPAATNASSDTGRNIAWFALATGGVLLAVAGGLQVRSVNQCRHP
jgi:hypothetical protein